MKLHLLPLALFIIMIGFFVCRLSLIERGNMPRDIPSVVLNKPAPGFNLPPLLKTGLKTADFKGKVTLVNFFASWCVDCLAEHKYLTDLASKGAVLAGIDYKDTPANGQAWLAKNGNPYNVIAIDRDGHTGIDFGVYGVPETYVIDKQGIIRYKQTGAVTPEIISDKLLPLIKELNK